MTRGRLAVLVGIIGFFAAGASLLLLLVMGSVFADARTENIAGPGVDIFVRTPFPTKGSTVVLDVEARGGSRAGIENIEIRWGDVPLLSHRGKGVTWGYSIRSGKQRGSDTEQVMFPMPVEVKPGQAMPLAIEVEYVVAMSENGGFSNQHKRAVIPLEVKMYSSSGRTVAQLSRVGLALGCFVLWFMLVWGVARLYVSAGEAASHDGKEIESIGLLMGFLGGSILGYWLFAWRIMNALELRSTLWAMLLMIVWCVAPLVFIWKWNKRRKNRSDLPAARVVAR